MTQGCPRPDPAEAETRSEHGVGYPAHIKREFERYLSCGTACRRVDSHILSTSFDTRRSG